MEDYVSVRDYAQDVGGLDWFHDKKKLLCVSREANQQVKTFVGRKISKQKERMDMNSQMN